MKPFMQNEYHPLHFCLVVYPCNIQIIDHSNSYIGDFNKNLANTQYNNLINTLIEHHVKLNFLHVNGSPIQLFTRDIGFIIEDMFFIANMTEPLRQSEIQPLIEFTKTYAIKPHLMSHKAEGGDIFYHNKKLFIGLGNRTNERAVEEILQVLSHSNIDCKVIKVRFDTSKIHLDCVFNILDEDTCLISKGIFNPHDIAEHFSKIIEVPESEVDSLAANIINLGNGKILCGNKILNGLLLDHGYDSIFIDYSEIIKTSGSLGCSVLPIVRNKKQNQ